MFSPGVVMGAIVRGFLVRIGWICIALGSSTLPAAVALR
jgi:hypothetical protein